jgi:hypothetical protein
MQIKREVNRKYKVTTCIYEIEGRCHLDLFVYYLMEPFRR